MKNPVSDSPLRGVKEMETGGHNDKLIDTKILNYRIVDQDTLSDYVSDDYAVETYWPPYDDKGQIISWRHFFDGLFYDSADAGTAIKSSGAAYPLRQEDCGFRIARNR